MLIISISTFICIAGGVMAIYWLLFRPASATAVRLRELGDQNGGAAVLEDLVWDDANGQGWAQVQLPEAIERFHVEVRHLESAVVLVGLA